MDSLIVEMSDIPSTLSTTTTAIIIIISPTLYYNKKSSNKRLFKTMCLQNNENNM